ncbi:MAG: hypothetical protein AUG17_02735 [Crenarchaeota archaeon 13_1_20CM_2_53_14]|nr:MAG: hypothetical protein AUG17_02735 [Crenarchaeota archaeon 13_1_20CM_2_53_14]TMI41667.1 MAG: hypothetical protein E6H21_02395 [Candidatus Bathyarchaeota archaeon]
MQLEGTGLLKRANGRKRERKGLEAIFTSHKKGMKVEILTGAGGIITGLFLSVFALLRVDAPQALGPWGDTIYSALTLGSLGALLLICGGGTITFAVLHRETKLRNTFASPSTDVDSLGFAKDHDTTQRMFGPGSRIGVVALIQSVVLVALYSGFVQEFESNLTMQSWIRSNFPIGQSLLNWEGVLILSVSLALLLLQFLPGRFLSE